MSLKPVKTEETLLDGLWELPSPLSNGTNADPYGLSSPRLGFATPETAIAIISTDFKFGW